MSQKIFNILSIVMITFFVSCESEKNSDETTGNSNYSFIKIGNQWKYDYKMEGALSSIELTYHITDSEEDGFYTVLMESSVGGEVDYFWYASGDVFADELGAFPPNYIFPLMPANAKVGDKWSADEEDEDLGEISREIISMSDEVDVPAGAFSNCIKVKETYSGDNQIVNYYWFSSEYGIVKKLCTGWADIDDSPRIYFNIDIKLKEYTF